MISARITLRSVICTCIPFNAIKIDRSFVLALAHEKGQRMFGGLCALAASLELAVVVEGVETPEQLAIVPQWDDITVQGWIFSAALAPDDFADFVSVRRGGVAGGGKG
ncbi:EAL domain-containing protein [Thauera sp.]|uniref:EAL domain-containing protein n=1 Tax=Thauera sp. TaxID=1905334 RepID=UPI0039E5EE29